MGPAAGRPETLIMKPRIALLAAALLWLAPWPAAAAELLGKERVEVTPFFGYRIGGHFNGFSDTFEYPWDGARSWGGLVDINTFRDNYKVEFLWSHQKTGFDRFVQGRPRAPLTIDHFQAGVLQEVGVEKARVAVSALVGGTRLSAGNLGADTRFSGSVGGIAKLFLSPHVALRFDARAYLIFVKGVGGTLCVNGICSFAYSGTALWQGDFTGGVTFAF